MRAKMTVVIVGLILLGAVGAWPGEHRRQSNDGLRPRDQGLLQPGDPGEGRLLACFYAHEDKLSGRCQYALYEAAAELDAFATAVTHVATQCKDDLMKYCAEVELGEGRVGTCLLDHKAELTAGCQQAIADVGLEKVEE